jgi:hypothetical protein
MLLWILSIKHSLLGSTVELSFKVYTWPARHNIRGFFTMLLVALFKVVVNNPCDRITTNDIVSRIIGCVPELVKTFRRNSETKKRTLCGLISGDIKPRSPRTSLF